MNNSDQNERYKIPQLQSSIRRTEMFTVVLPLVYQMMHPYLPDVGVALYNDDQRRCFRQAIEIMITFDIKLKDISPADGFQCAVFDPDIAHLVCFGPKSRLPMRVKTQSQIMQNYEAIKQRMLLGVEVEDNSPDAKSNQFDRKSAAQKPTTGAIFSLLGQLVKKRSKADEHTEGKLIYKFKEGHSKNFKREAPITYFY